MLNQTMYTCLPATGACLCRCLWIWISGYADCCVLSRMHRLGEIHAVDRIGTPRGCTISRHGSTAARQHVYLQLFKDFLVQLIIELFRVGVLCHLDMPHSAPQTVTARRHAVMHIQSTGTQPHTTAAPNNIRAHPIPTQTKSTQPQSDTKTKQPPTCIVL